MIRKLLPFATVNNVNKISKYQNESNESHYYTF